MRAALGTHSLDDVAVIGTLDRKAEDAALTAFCERHGIALTGFTPAQIEACLDEHPLLPRSATVHEHTGVQAICEPCALLAAPGSTLLAGKYAGDGITVAIATRAPTE
ncbi:cobalamin biosynthesis protein [Pandoraea vervacti]|uniref:cobalamin biosynthesis protein n=1 Tax=Pandoraea vervacti TaxID=656178 RepID=UPI0030018F52